MGKYVFEKQFDGDDKKNAILAPLIYCHNPDRAVSREPNIHAEQFSIDISFNSKM